MINEEVQEYVIKTLKQTRLKIYTEQELKERKEKCIKEGMEKGIEKGIEKGLEEKTRELAVKLKTQLPDLLYIVKNFSHRKDGEDFGAGGCSFQNYNPAVDRRCMDEEREHQTAVYLRKHEILV